MVKSNEELRDRQFAAAYVSNGYSATAAYQECYPNVLRASAAHLGSQMMKKKTVKDLISRARHMAMTKLRITEERVLEEIARAAFLDVADLLKDDGSLKEIRDIPEDARRAIASLDIEQLFEGSGADREKIGTIAKLKMEPKLKALELLGRHLKMFTDRIEHETGTNLSAAIIAGRRRSGVSDDSGEDFLL